MSAPIQTPFGDPLHRGQARLRYADHVRNPHHGDWSPEEDGALLDAISDGMTFRQASAALGTRSRDACIGRMFRLRQKLGGQAA